MHDRTMQCLLGELGQDALTDSQRRVIARYGWPLPVIAGADGEEESGEGEGNNEEESGSTGTGSGSNEDDDGDDEDDDVIKVSKTEYEQTKKELAARRRKEQKAERDAKEAARRARAEQGQFKELAEEAQRERDEAVRERDEARAELQRFQGRSLISKVAKRLNFEDPDDARVWFSEYAREGEEITKESDVEAVCKRILKDKPRLQAKAPKTGGPGNGGGGGTLTFEDIQAMSEQEHGENFHKPEYQAALRAGPNR